MYCDEITFVIFTYNEEARVERAVRNFVKFGRVLVVDNHSTDRTREIATRIGARVLLHKNPGWVEDAGTVSTVKAAVETAWIYWAFADEMINRSTIEAVINAVTADTFDIVRMTRKNYYYGAFCHDAFASDLNRVFRKDAIDFTGNEIHHFGKPNVPESRICHLDPHRFFVHHFISNDAKSYLRTIDGYTDIESKRSGPGSVSQFFLRAVRSFIGNYIYRKGYKAGLPGFFLGLQMLYYEGLLSMKSYEAKEHLTVGEIEERNNVIRDTLLRGLQ